MKKITNLVFSSFVVVVTSMGLASAKPADSIYEFKIPSLMGGPVDFQTYKGKVLLIVNVASKCGYTPQYEGLQKIYTKYKDRGFEVLGFPSNQFLSQEPGTAQDIAKFCKMNYGVTFPMFAKAGVKGESKQELYQFLIASSQDKGEVSWNFEKFLVDKSGKVVARYKSRVKPDSDEVVNQIEKYLKN